MSGFSAEWLDLREPADAAARSEGLTETLAILGNREVAVLDLGAGTGANARFLIEHLPAQQRWVLVDRDTALLEALPRRCASWASARGYAVTQAEEETILKDDRRTCRMTSRQTDLRTAIGDPALFDGCHLVTASALLDLVSAEWLDALADRCAEQRAHALFALTYDGRIDCEPREPEDAIVRALVNRHQRTDKGFGAALGPEASHATAQSFQRRGYDVRTAPSDWALSADAGELQRQLIDGWGQAAAEVDPSLTTMLHSWRARRLAHVDRGRSQIVVGHLDLLAHWSA